MKKNTLSGFTLIEMLVSSALLSIAILGIQLQYTQVSLSEGSQNTQMQARGVLEQVVSRVKASPGLFPALYDATGKPISYTACYTLKGVPLPNKFGSGFWGIYINAPNPGAGANDPIAATRPDPTQVTDMCNQIGVGFEVHFTQFTPINSFVDVIPLTPANLQVKTNRKYYRAQIELERSF
ncbi:MAG: prepilin-type N-terminal cleavage/methylation domain-containing protein [Bacteriovoracia bacterium]